MLKQFPVVNLVSAFQEAIIYSAMGQYQSFIIPFCYGVFDIDGADGVGILFENVHGPTLAEYLAGSIMGGDQIRNLYLACMYALRCMHDIGYTYRDIRGENIILTSTRQIVLIDF